MILWYPRKCLSSHNPCLFFKKSTCFLNAVTFHCLLRMLFLLCTYSLSGFKHSLGFNYHLFADDSQTALSPELPAYISTCWLHVPTRRSHRHRHRNRTRMNPPSLLRCLLSFSSSRVTSLQEWCYYPCSNQKFGILLDCSTLSPHPISNLQVLEYSSKPSITLHLQWHLFSFGKH